MAESSKGICRLQVRKSKMEQMEFSRKFEVCVGVCVGYVDIREVMYALLTVALKSRVKQPKMSS